MSRKSSASSDVKFYDEKIYLKVFEKRRDIEIYNDPGFPVKSDGDSAQDFASSFDLQPCDSPTFNRATSNASNASNDIQTRCDVSSDHVSTVDTQKTHEQQNTLPFPCDALARQASPTLQVNSRPTPNFPG